MSKFSSTGLSAGRHPSLRRSLQLLAPQLALLTCVSAQVIEFRPPDPYQPNIVPENFGQSIAILSDVDNGGRRELLVGAPGNGGLNDATGKIYMISTEGPQAPNNSNWVLQQVWLGSVIGGLPSTRVQFGYKVLNVGNIDGVPGDEFAVSAPRVPAFGSSTTPTGRVYIYSARPTGLFPLGTLIGVDTFGTSLSLVNTPTGTQLAVGVPGVDQVHLFSLASTPVSNTPTRILDGGGRTGNLGWSLAAGPATAPNGLPSYYLAAGSPTYGFNNTLEGYVAIWNLSLPSNSPTRFLYRGIQGEQMGTAVASIGFVPGGSAFPDFAVLGKNNQPFGNSKMVVFDTPSNLILQPNTTPWLAEDATLNTSQTASDGRMTSMGDINGDGLREFAAAVGGGLRFYSYGAGGLTTIFSAGASVHSDVTSGPDIRQANTTDLVVGPTFQTPNPQNLTVRILPIATTASLPNSTGLTLTPGLNRPIVTPLNQTTPNTYSLTASYNSSTPLAVFLLGDIFPATPYMGIPIVGIPYVSPNAITLGAGAVSTNQPVTFNLNMPSNGVWETAIMQAVVFPATGPWPVSNGILARYGQF